MEKQIRDIIGQHVGGTYEAKQKAVEEILLLFSVSGRSEQLCQWHDWVKHPTHAKIGAMICRNCRTELV